MMTHQFELTDGKTCRKAYFSKVTTADGLKIITLSDDITTGKRDAIISFVDIAIKYLVLINPETNVEQRIATTVELDAIFDNPFLAMKIAEEFEKHIAPYLQSLSLTQNNFMELKAQALNK